MTTTTRAAALGVFAATLAAVLAFGTMPGSVTAHTGHEVTVTAGLIGAFYDEHDHRIEPFICISSTLQADTAHVNPAHKHPMLVEVITPAKERWYANWVSTVGEATHHRSPPSPVSAAGAGTRSGASPP